MKLFTKSLLLIGVTLCVAPIFSIAHAQQSNNDARMLLQMQEMQAEIAALRDMVERQQYQLQRMQRKIQEAEQTAMRPSAVRPSTSEQSAMVGSEPQTSDGFPDPSSNTENQTLTDDEKWLVSRSGQVEANTSEQAADSTFSENAGDEGYYQAPQPNERRPSSANDVNTVVEEREITAPPLPQTATGSNYPPVEDREIGAAGSRTAQSPPSAQRADQIDTRPRALPLPPQTPSGAIDAQQIPTEPVIAIPGSRLPSSNPRANATVQALEPATNPRALPEQEYYQQGIALVRQNKLNDAIQMF